MPSEFLKFLAKAGLNVVSNGIAGDLAVEVLPGVARAVWKWWAPGRTEEERKAEVEQLARLSPEEARAHAEAAVSSLEPPPDGRVRRALTTYLAQVPDAIRRSQRRPADPSGKTLDIHLSLCRAEDLVPLLPAHTPHFQPGDRPPGLGDWELEELLGVGGFGEVWRARNLHLGQHAALKFCLDPHAAAILRREADLLGRLLRHGGHPGIVALRHTYLSADPPCLQYEFVPGGDLAGLALEWHRARRPSLVEDVTRLMRDLAEVTAFAHGLSPPVVHRDLKPANILIRREPDGTPRPCVSDFGLAGIARHAVAEGSPGVSQTLPFTVVRGAHTPLYASPEQIRGADPDPRDDVYSLGVIWYQLLTGDLSLLALPADWQDELSERGVPGKVVRLIGACLATRVERRPAGAADLREEIDHLCPDLSAGDVLIRPVAPAAACETGRGRVEELEEAIRTLGRTFGGPALRPLVEELLRLAPHRADLRQLLEELSPGRRLPRRLTNCLGMEFVRVPAGTFLMGSPRSEAERHGDETQREVSIPRGFYLAVHPVTQHHYATVMGRNPSFFCQGNGGGPAHPVEQVSWGDALDFCEALSEVKSEREAGRTYRLPDEAEWEYACRAGTATPFHFGGSACSTQANFDGRHPYGDASEGPWLQQTSPVGCYEPNAWGLFDLHGNVWEWCADEYADPELYGKADEGKRARVLRGGSWFNEGGLCRSACRLRRGGGERDFHVGFRVVVEVAG
jgi:formylglycine-generating enzyme required for sulfatase activity